MRVTLDGSILGFIGHPSLTAIADGNQGWAAQKDRKSPVRDEMNQLAAMILTGQSAVEFKKNHKSTSADGRPATLSFSRE